MVVANVHLLHFQQFRCSYNVPIMVPGKHEDAYAVPCVPASVRELMYMCVHVYRIMGTIYMYMYICHPACC